MKLDIGCGKKKRKGYVSCDARKLHGVDYVCPADKLPFPNESIDEIYSRHVIEHLTLKQFIKTLAEWSRVLKKGGMIYIICPNLLWHLEQILKGSPASFYQNEKGKNARYWGFGSLFGWQAHAHDVHKFGYYFELLRDILEEAGFDSIENLTNKKQGLEKAVHHLEVRGHKKQNFINYKKSFFYKHFTVKH